MISDRATTDAESTDRVTTLAASLAAVLTPGQVLSDANARAVYGRDASQERGTPLLVALPVDAGEVAAIVRWANAHDVALVARGAGTGLAGGAVARDAVVVSMARLRTLRIDPATRTAVVGPGVTRDAVDEAAAAHGLAYPPDPSSGVASTIGGNVACNAGGPHCLSRGVTQRWVLGMEVVLASGLRVRLGAHTPPRVVSERRDEVESNTGKAPGNAPEPNEIHAPGGLSDQSVSREPSAVLPPSGDLETGEARDPDDLPLPTSPRDRDSGRFHDLPLPMREAPTADWTALFVGSEGTLGLVTEVTLRLAPRPEAARALLAAFPDVASAGAAVTALLSAGLRPAAVELMDQRIMRIVEDWIAPGLPVESGAALLLSVEGRPESLDALLVDIAAALSASGAIEVRRAQDDAQSAALWRGRKSVGGAMSRLAPAYYSVDVVVPRGELAAALREIETILEAAELPAGAIAHVGDGNLHPMLPLNPADPADRARVERVAHDIAEAALRRGGTITGEHGIGREKRALLARQLDATTLAAMRELRAAFDPRGLLNPGAMLPPEEGSGDTVGAGTEAGAEAALGAGARAGAGTETGAGIGPGNGAIAGTEGEIGQAKGNRSVSMTVAVEGAESAAESVADPNHPSQLVHGRAGMPSTIVVEAANFVLHAPADATVADACAAAAAAGRRLPLSATSPTTTLRALLDGYRGGADTLEDGAPRDLLLSATITLPDGRVIRCGRAVHKNVAGYDLHRLMVGARGRLGRFEAVSLALVPPARP